MSASERLSDYRIEVWEKCPVCAGLRSIEGDDERIACGNCGGLGETVHSLTLAELQDLLFEKSPLNIETANPN
jgi:DnaJ-class molecular chaperone